MIDTDIPLLSLDYTHLLLQEVMGDHGLIVVGMGKAGERGFQMLYRFSDICDRLEESGVNVTFVYQRTSDRHVLDAMSLFAQRARQKPCLLLDDVGRFFRTPPSPKSLCAMYLNREFKRLNTAEVPLQGEAWDPLLRVFFAQVVASCIH